MSDAMHAAEKRRSAKTGKERRRDKPRKKGRRGEVPDFETAFQVPYDPSGISRWRMDPHNSGMISGTPIWSWRPTHVGQLMYKKTEVGLRGLLEENSDAVLALLRNGREVLFTQKPAEALSALPGANTGSAPVTVHASDVVGVRGPIDENDRGSIILQFYPLNNTKEENFAHFACSLDLCVETPTDYDELKDKMERSLASVLFHNVFLPKDPGDGMNGGVPPTKLMKLEQRLQATVDDTYKHTTSAGIAKKPEGVVNLHIKLRFFYLDQDEHEQIARMLHIAKRRIDETTQMPFVEPTYSATTTFAVGTLTYEERGWKAEDGPPVNKLHARVAIRPPHATGHKPFTHFDYSAGLLPLTNILIDAKVRFTSGKGLLNHAVVNWEVPVDLLHGGGQRFLQELLGVLHGVGSSDDGESSSVHKWFESKMRFDTFARMDLRDQTEIRYHPEQQNCVTFVRWFVTQLAKDSLSTKHTGSMESTTSVIDFVEKLDGWII